MTGRLSAIWSHLGTRVAAVTERERHFGDDKTSGIKQADQE